MKVLIFVLLPFIFLFLSCTSKKDNSVLTFQVTKSDYFEKISVTGTVQAVVNHPVLPPRSMYGQMTVVRLAEDGAVVNKGDTICILTVPELDSKFRELMTSVDNLEADLKKTEADNKLNIAVLEAQLATNDAQLKIASLDSLHMRYATEVNRKLLELEMRKALIEKIKVEKKLAARKIIGETDIKQMKARIMQEKSRAQTMMDQVNSMTIIAQRDGIVMRTESPVFTVMGPQGIGKLGGPIREGSVLFMGTPVLQFPDISRMQISAEVMEADFKVIEKGQKVVIAIDAEEKLITTGKINRKSLIGKSNQRYSDSKVKFYEIIIEVDSCHLKMKPGLSADCEITIREANDTLCIPTVAIFERDSARVVYVKRKKDFMPVRIETGLSGSSQTIITGGLKGDEVISLSEPPNKLITTEK
jgi:multidrug efflux pump subunit AcrA (membrane-fusion protein)